MPHRPRGYGLHVARGSISSFFVLDLDNRAGAGRDSTGFVMTFVAAWLGRGRSLWPFLPRRLGDTQPRGRSCVARRWLSFQGVVPPQQLLPLSLPHWCPYSSVVSRHVMSRPLRPSDALFVRVKVHPSETDEFVQDVCFFLLACFRETDVRTANLQRGVTRKRRRGDDEGSGSASAGVPPRRSKRRG